MFMRTWPFATFCCPCGNYFNMCCCCSEVKMKWKNVSLPELEMFSVFYCLKKDICTLLNFVFIYFSHSKSVSLTFLELGMDLKVKYWVRSIFWALLPFYIYILFLRQYILCAFCFQFHSTGGWTTKPQNKSILHCSTLKWTYKRPTLLN